MTNTQPPRIPALPPPGDPAEETRRLIAGFIFAGLLIVGIVAASYPWLVAALIASVVGTYALGRIAYAAVRYRRVCIPGTQVCFRWSTDPEM